MEMPFTARNVVRVISTIRAPFTREGFLRAEAFAGVKISKKEGLSRRYKDSQVSNAS